MADGVILYQGPSLLDGAPIVVIATGLKNKSENAKTGAMVQTYILRSGVSPTVAIQTGDDASICGNCPHRGATVDGRNAGRTCYVNVGQGPGAVFRAFRAGKYATLPQYNWDVFKGRKVRFGTYGDPAAVPTYVWQGIANRAAGWTGYTHQWRNNGALSKFCMASVDSEPEALEAQRLGWRTFRVALPGVADRLASEVRCPASAEAGKKLNCASCLACSGGTRRGSIVIQAHGGFAVMANYRKREAVAA
jgi:hypothetical protein